MQVTNFILATAGHVDHGKSALVTGLTGTDPDRLPEEKARGITIELGFAHFDLASADGSRTFRIGVVDVPGHEDFVKNMVAGVGSIDAALLVVAADDGWMPQTEEHLQILAYLGVTHAVVALSKIDLAREREAEVSEAIRERLRDSPLSGAPIVATSMRDPASIDNLRRALAELFARVDPPRDIGKPRLAVDRAFALRGVGTVVTGTLSEGELRNGQTAVIEPAGIATRIRNLQSHNQDVEIARPGLRVALNLADVEPRTGRSSHGDRVVARGDVITIESLGKPSSCIDALVIRSPRSAVCELKHGAVAQLHHGTATVGARVELIDRAPLAAGEQSRARLRLQAPIFAFVGDRFILRDWSQQHTLAGGVVLDAHPPRKPDGMAKDASVESLVRGVIDRAGAVTRDTLLRDSIFSANEIDCAIEQQIANGNVVAIDPLVCRREFWDNARTRVIATVDEQHRAHPEQAGLALTTLRKQVDEKLLEILIDDLCVNGFARRGTAIARQDHSPRLPAALQIAGDAIRKALRDNRFDPPSRAQLVASPNAHQAMKFLLASGEVVEVSKEIVLSITSFGEAIDRVRAYITANGPATVSDLKTLLNSSRRVMVPLLEKLDRDGITRREGDRRSLR